MNEVVFLVEDAVEGGLTARALGESIYTEADDLNGLREQIRDVVNCHFEQENKPQVIRLDFVREEVFAL
ncbi:MAG: 2-oxoisovalerate dehydrogenase [Acidobacteriota bacterium]|nr:2-oxoisovalerate dehydrogenase [Acidobacteriota bacterium]